MPSSPRRLPPPWTIEERNDACFVVTDSAGQQLVYVYFEEEPGRRSAAKLLTKDEARRIAVNLARLPELTNGATALALTRLIGFRRATNEQSKFPTELNCVGEQALSSLIGQSEGRAIGGNDGDWFHRPRTLCLVARQYWSEPSTTLCGG